MRLKASLIRFLLVILLFSTLSSCIQTVPPAEVLPAWKYTDLLWLSDGENPSSQNQLIAAYTRQTSQEIQMRMDFLELSQDKQVELAIALDTQFGGENFLPGGHPAGLSWDVLFLLHPNQVPKVQFPKNSPERYIIPRLIIDYEMDTMIVAWNKNLFTSISKFFNVQIFFLDPNSKSIVSQTPALSPVNPPPAPAPLILAFWNTLPASTPAQALRRWDGAHTGPIGQRHGLSQLTSQASQWNIPIVLLDLRSKQSLLALDYLGVDESLKSLSAKGQVILPVISGGYPNRETGTSDSQKGSIEMGWKGSSFAYGAYSQPLPNEFSHYFANLPTRDHIITFNSKKLIPLPDSYSSRLQITEKTITREGLLNEIKLELLRIATSNDPSDLVVLGGDLPRSLWADEATIKHVMKYIANHPWIDPLSESEILQFPSHMTGTWPLSGCDTLLCQPALLENPLNTHHGAPIPSRLSAQGYIRLFGELIDSLPNNVYANSAQQLFDVLTAPQIDPDIRSLRANYLPQIGYLVYASQWAEQPGETFTCSQDVDWDGSPECVLATENILTIFELDGGRLVFAGTPLHQWIGPSSQFAIGTGDPSTWRLDMGEAADPQVIVGAFSESEEPFTPYFPILSDCSLILQNQSGDHRKTFTLAKNTLQVEIEAKESTSYQIPIILDTQSYPPDHWSDQLPIGCQPGICAIPYSSQQLMIQTPIPVYDVSSFLDSAALMRSAEIPDRSYPRGHFLPFSLAVVNLKTELNHQSLKIRFEIK